MVGPLRETVFKLKLNGRILSADDGTEFSVKGVRGRFTFHHAVEEGGVILWITGYGGSVSPTGIRSWRSFDPSLVRTVHSKKKL